MSRQAFFFDMDGTIFDSMPNHALAWEQVVSQHGLTFTRQDCFRQEGRTGIDVLEQLFLQKQAKGEPTEIDGLSPQQAMEHIKNIYAEKSRLFHSMGDTMPVNGVTELLTFLHNKGNIDIWIVTGSAQQTLFDKLNTFFPNIFAPERMVTANDVIHGKPKPEPYLKAWERSGLDKKQCFVVENAPLGIMSGKAAGLYTYAVNTGPLTDNDLWDAGADCVVRDMHELLKQVQFLLD